MSKILQILLFAILATMAACSFNFDRAGYVEWVENADNGLLLKRSTSSAEYILQYEPAFYKAIRISEKEESEALSEISQQFDDMHHFLLKIRTVDGAFQNEQERDQYLAYELRKDIRFVEGADTISQTVMYHLESSGGITPYQQILVAFPKEETSEKLQFIIDPGKLESEKVVFNFNKSILEKLETIQKRVK